MADFSSRKITTTDIQTNGVQSMPDVPSGSTLEVKQAFDKLVSTVVMPKLNGLIDDLKKVVFTLNEKSAAEQIGCKAISGLNSNNADNLYTMLVSLKIQLDAVTQGIVPDNSISESKLTLDAAMKSLLTDYAIASEGTPSALSTTDTVAIALGKIERYFSNLLDGTQAAKKADGYSEDGEIKIALDGKAPAYNFDDVPTLGSGNLIASGDLHTAFGLKEDKSNKKTDLTDNSDDYYVSQKAVKTAVDNILTALGDIDSLVTTAKDNLVNAVNENKNRIDLKADLVEGKVPAEQLPYEDMTRFIDATNVTGETVSIPNTDSGFVDQIELLGNTTGGGGTPSTPIAIVSPTSPVKAVSVGKNLWCPSITTVTASGLTITIDSTTGIITVNGTASGGPVINLGKLIPLPLKGQTVTYSVHDVSATGVITDFTVGLRYIGGGNAIIDYPLTRKVLNLTADIDYCLFYAGSGRTFTNQQFKMQVEFGDVTNPQFERYSSAETSIPLLDKDGNPVDILSVSAVRDRIYTYNGKAYLQKKCKSTTSNVTDALPNSAYIGTQGNGTSSGQNITVSGTVVYQLANPEIIELHPSAYEAIKSIPTKDGQTNLWATGANGVSAWLDVTEMQMAGNKIDALLKNTSGDSVLPITTADNVLMPDGTTAEDAIRNLTFVAIRNTLTFDKVIRTQADFETLIASPTWLDAKSVALIGQFTLSTTDNIGIKIPSTVKQIHGFNRAKITITNYLYHDTSAKGGLWYAIAPTTLDYSIRDLEVDCTGLSGRGFRNCTNLTNCTGTGTATGTGAGTSGRGFTDCTNLTNCTGTGTAIGTGTGSIGYGFRDCTNLTNCTGTGTGSGTTDGYGFYGIINASNCKDGGSSTNMWGGTNKNINVETCRKTPVAVTAGELTTLNT